MTASLPSVFARRHTLRIEAAGAVLLYALYDCSRGLVRRDRTEALTDARRIASLERTLHLFGETAVQRAAADVPLLVGTLGIAYLTLHLAVTGGVLVWLHTRRPAAYPPARTTLLFASLLALAVFLVFPAAPPRLADIGIRGTIGVAGVSLDHGASGFLYNPYAAVPSMHVAYALVVGWYVMRHGRAPLMRVAGAAYPPFVLLVVVATGNHFFFDAAAGALVAGAAAAASCTNRRTTGGI
jgi:hypothetical protein